MATATRKRLKRGTLNRELILDAATSLIAAKGIDGLTMSTLAKLLKSDRKAMYRHFSDKDELLAALLDRLLEEMPPVPAGAAPRERLEHKARSLREVMVRHQGSAALFAESPFSPVAVQMIEDDVAGLRRGGLDDELAVDLLQAVLAFAIGTAIQADADPDGTWEDLISTAAELGETSAIAATADCWKRTYDEQFERGIAALLHCLR